MNQPTDRLGQPLSVGDWVIFDCVTKIAKTHKDYGKTMSVTELLPKTTVYLDDDPTKHMTNDFVRCSTGRLYLAGSVRKINPKPETTTWDKCVFVPESVQTAN